MEGAEPVTINSMCAVFAESEIIGLLAQETPPGSIALGCIYSICRRTAIFAQKLAPEHPKVLLRRTGPVAGGAGGAGPVSGGRERHCPSPVPV